MERASRLYVTTGATFFVAWTLAAVLGAPARTQTVLAVMGFVLHVAFGKSMTLVPSYFESELRYPGAPFLQYPLTAGGAALLAWSSAGSGREVFAATAAAMWLSGVLVFAASLLSSVAGGYLRRETGTAESKQELRKVDLAANLFAPFAFVYLVLGSYEVLALDTGLPPVFDGYPPAAYHLLAAGFAAMLVFSVGFRLLPRLMKGRPSVLSVAPVLAAGALAPPLVSLGFTREPFLQIGGALLAFAVAGFAAVVLRIYLKSDSSRVGADAVAVAAVAGVTGVSIGLYMAFYGVDTALLRLHYRFNLAGFLGLTIVGVAYHLYPPAVSRLPYAGDRAARFSVASVAGGLVLEAVGGLTDVSAASKLGEAAVLAGSLVFLYLVVGVMTSRTG